MSSTNGPETFPVSVYGNNNNTNADEAEPMESPAPPCGPRCCREWSAATGWFDVQDGPHQTIDVAASFGPTSLSARLLKFGYMGWMISTLVGKWWLLRDEPWFFLAYLTHWSLIIVVLWSILSFVNSLVPLPQPTTTSSSENESSSVSFRTKVSWILYPIAAELACIVTLLFWTVEFDYDAGVAPTYWTFMTHGGSFVATWIEGLAIDRIPMRWKHVLPVMLTGAIYIGWTIVHQLATDIGNPRKQDEDPETNDDLIYGVLDYKESTASSIGLVLVVIFVAIPLIHWTLWLLSLYQFPCGGCRGANRRYLSTTDQKRRTSATKGSIGDEESLYVED